MKVYLFGNCDFTPDSFAFSVEKKLGKKTRDLDIQFISVKPNEDLPFVNEDHVVLIDAVLDLKEVTVFTEKDLDKIALPPRASAHDFDLGFQLRYLKKLGKVNKVTIIGIPMSKLSEKDYDLIHSILRKLVAQDMQGS
ncbi:MAG: hypothetical protein ACD_22C00142G0006 [uncultured bacterium]|nr:MAG: hypothetical protein ACD_22C00142G0006 [uncultured bacterium]